MTNEIEKCRKINTHQKRNKEARKFYNCMTKEQTLKQATSERLNYYMKTTPIKQCRKSLVLTCDKDIHSSDRREKNNCGAYIYALRLSYSSPTDTIDPQIHTF
jgi:hypothetical protein